MGGVNVTWEEAIETVTTIVGEETRTMQSQNLRLVCELHLVALSRRQALP